MAVYKKSQTLSASRLLLWMIAAITIISMAIPSIFKMRSLGRTDRIAFTVGSIPVTQAALERKIRALHTHMTLLQQHLAQQQIPFDPTTLIGDYKTVAAQALVQETVLNTVADTMHLTMSPAYIAQQLTDPYFIIQELGEFIPATALMHPGGLTTPALADILARQHISMQEFESAVEQIVKRNTVLSLLMGGTYVPRFLSNELYQQLYAKKQLAILTIPQEPYLKKAQQEGVSTEQLHAFFAAQNKKGCYDIPEKRSAIVWYFKPTEQAFPVSKAEITAYYQDHKRAFIKDPLKVVINRIDINQETHDAYARAQRIVNALRTTPHAIQEIAQQESLPIKKQTVNRHTTKNQAIVQAAFALEHDLDTADIIKTKKGFTLIQRVERIQPTYKSEESVATDIAQILRTQKLKALLEEIVSGSPATVRDTIAQCAQEKHATRKEIRLTPLTDEPVIKAIFNTPLSTASVVPLDDERSAVVMVTEIQKRYTPALEAVQEQATKDYYHARALQLLQETLGKLKKGLQTESIETLAKQYQLPLTKTPLMPLELDNPSIKALLEKGITNEVLGYLQRPGASITLDNGTVGFLVYLAALEPVSIDQEKMRALQKNLYQQYQTATYSDFIASLSKHVTISIDYNGMQPEDQ